MRESYLLEFNQDSRLKKKKFFSYQDCWNYAIFLGLNVFSWEVKSDIIFLCKTKSVFFWQNFTYCFLTFYYYRKICDRINYLSQDLASPYLIGRSRFCRLTFFVTKDVFIPQSDTEFLVKIILQITKKNWLNKYKKILEIGTGCGNIAISLAKTWAKWNIVATDINKKALELAAKNAVYHQVSNVNFVLSDLFENIDKINDFDLIVSNPPYIDNKEYKELSFSVKQQPYKALVAQEQGLFFYRKIIQNWFVHCCKKTLLIIEISPSIKLRLIKSLISWFSEFIIEVFLDYGNNERVLIIYCIR